MYKIPPRSYEQEQAISTHHCKEHDVDYEIANSIIEFTSPFNLKYEGCEEHKTAK